MHKLIGTFGTHKERQNKINPEWAQLLVPRSFTHWIINNMHNYKEWEFK